MDLQSETYMSEACNVVVVTHDSGVSFVCHNRPQDMPSVLRRCPRFVEAGDAAPATAAFAEQARNADSSPRLGWGITLAATPGIHLELCSFMSAPEDLQAGEGPCDARPDESNTRILSAPEV